jgi:hypothetical protein
MPGKIRTYEPYGAAAIDRFIDFLPKTRELGMTHGEMYPASRAKPTPAAATAISLDEKAFTEFSLRSKQH